MTRHTLCASLTLSLLLLAPSVALAEKEDFFGYYVLKGKHSNGRKTQVLIQIRSDRVTRSATYTSGTWEGRDVGDWTAARSDMEWRQDEKLLVVTYDTREPKAAPTRSGLIDTLDLDNVTRADAVSALEEERRAPPRLVRAFYFLRASGELVEYVSNVNRSRDDPSEWKWRWISTRGESLTPRRSDPPSADWAVKAREYIAEDWAEFTYDRYYGFAMSREDSDPDFTQADQEDIEAQGETWSDLDKAWLSFNGDQVVSDAIDARYAAGQSFYNETDQIDIPRDQVEIWNVRFTFELDGDEYYATKTYVFDRNGGILLEQDEEFEEED